MEFTNSIRKIILALYEILYGKLYCFQTEEINATGFF